MKEKTIKYLDGKVKFISMWDPIYFGTSDITEEFFGFLEKAKGKPVNVEYERNRISIKIMESDRFLEFVRTTNGKGETESLSIATQVKDGIGWTNTALQFEYTFTSLIGREARLEITEDELTVTVDVHNDDVPQVYYTHGNSSTLSPGYKVEEVCKPGKSDCYIFLTADKDGFSCEKFNGVSARMLLDRYANGKMNSTRLGNCKCSGRWESLRKKKEDEKVQ